MSKSKSKSKSKSGGKGKHGSKTLTLALSWLDAPAEHDYPSAASFLNLTARAGQIDVITALLSLRRRRCTKQRKTSCAQPDCPCFPSPTPKSARTLPASTTVSPFPRSCSCAVTPKPAGH